MTLSTFFASAATRVRSFGRSRRGSALPLVAAAIIPMIGAVGAATDLGRIYLTKSQMQAGVDAAALAGARAFGNTDGTANDRQQQVTAYFSGNFPAGFLGTGTVTPQPTFQTVNGVNQTIVTATGTLPMLFMQIFGKSTQTITTTAQAQLQPRPLEVMVVLDNTGSMAGILDGSNTSMDALKISMHNFLNVLYQGATSRPDLALGMINYTITTNVGSILKKFGVTVEDQLGFTTAGQYSSQIPNFSWPNNALAWKGCVADDATHVDMSSDLSVRETDAYDIQRLLPNDKTGMPAIKPFLYPPAYLPTATGTTGNADPASSYYAVRPNVEAANNLYLLNFGKSGSEGQTYSDTIANMDVYRGYFYKFYIGLNNGSSSASDDVIVNATKGKEGTYYDPSSTDTWKVNTSRIPGITGSNWAQPTTYSIQVGRSGTDWVKTPNPTPNWQCPEAGMEVAYGRAKTDYDSFIDSKVAPVRPANGTMHHIGFLWGYRLLARDDIFTRSNPTTEAPKRAIVFMTDGVTAFSAPDANAYDHYFTAYGSIADKKLISTVNYTKFVTAEELRFKKTCEAAKAETNPPAIYIVALNRGGNDMNAATRSMFQACATGGYYETTSTSAITTAFSQIATELVDLHLTK